jgi:hypothetical protein
LGSPCSVCPAPPQGTDEFAANGLNVPFHFFHGDKDPAVPVKVSQDWTKNLKGLGASWSTSNILECYTTVGRMPMQMERSSTGLQSSGATGFRIG